MIQYMNDKTRRLIQFEVAWAIQYSKLLCFFRRDCFVIFLGGAILNLLEIVWLRSTLQQKNIYTNLAVGSALRMY